MRVARCRNSSRYCCQGSMPPRKCGCGRPRLQHPGRPSVSSVRSLCVRGATHCGGGRAGPILRRHRRSLPRRPLMRAASLLATVVFASTASSAAVAAQAAADIYLAPIRMRDGWVAIGTPRNITNRAGYDNQPAFTADGKALLFTSRIDDAQTEIYRYYLRNRRTVRVTNTPESEYSATPLADGGFAVIRVEADSTQRLWRFDANGGSARVMFPDLKPVGYQAWIDERVAALFILGSPPTLRLATLEGGPPATIADNIGRAIQKIPDWGGVSFVQRAADSTMSIKRVHGASRAVSEIAKLPPGGEYHAWTPRGALVATAGTKLLEWSPINGGTWREIADFASLGLRLSRVAISPRGDWIAFVGEK